MISATRTISTTEKHRDAIYGNCRNQLVTKIKLNLAQDG